MARKLDKFRGKLQGELTASKRIEQPDQVCFFLSLDLEGSTAFKTQAQGNGRKAWPAAMWNFYKLTSTQKTLPNAKIWKYIGDEVLLWGEIKSAEELPLTLSNSYRLLQEMSDLIEKLYSKKLSVKGTLWIAQVRDISDFDEAEQQLNHVKNLRLRALPSGDATSQVGTDFLGPEIDLGFRIAKHARKRILTLSAEFCHALFLSSNDTFHRHFDHMKIVGDEKFKGIWNDRAYPLIWYFKDMLIADFPYDEHLSNPQTRFLTENQERKRSSTDEISHIFKQLKKERNMKQLIRLLSKTPASKKIVKLIDNAE